jgi:hypothetical protein
MQRPGTVETIFKLLKASQTFFERYEGIVMPSEYGEGT